MKPTLILLTLASLATLRAIDAVAIRSAKNYIVTHEAVGRNILADILFNMTDIKVHHNFKYLHAASVELTEHQRHCLEAVKDVKVYPDGIVQTLDLERNPPVGLDRINQEKLPLDQKYCFTKDDTRVDVFVIDTGILVTHNEFDGKRAVFGANFADDGIDEDCVGHGTHVSGTIGGKTFGVAKGVHLTAVKVLGCDGGGAESNVIKGIEFVIDQHKKGDKSVINMSLGGRFSNPINKAVENAVAAGIHVVVAAGNDNADACESSPASAPDAITVAATDSTDQRAFFSNLGKCVDIFAPGVGILSSFIPKNTSDKILDGTSMASPHVAGIVAFLLQTGNFTPAEMKTKLASTATTGIIRDVQGSPNLLAFLNQPC